MVQETDLVCLVYLVVLPSGDPKSPQPLGDGFFCFQASILRPVSAGKFGASVVCACTTFHFQFVSTWEMDSADVVRVASLLKVLSSMCKFNQGRTRGVLQRSQPHIGTDASCPYPSDSFRPLF